MGCGPSEDVGNVGPSKLKVYGDYFSADTRAILAVCNYAGVEHEFIEIDTLTKKNLEPEYKEINPTGQIPMIAQGKNKVIAPGFVLYEWILNTNESAQEKFTH